MDHLWRRIATVMLGCCLAWALPVLAQQLPYPPECEQDIAQALQRSTTLQALAQQEREAIVRYFQRELQRLTKERDALKTQLEQGRPPVPQAPATESAPLPRGN